MALKQNTPFGLNEEDNGYLETLLLNHIAHVWDIERRYELNEDNRERLIESAVNSGEWIDSVDRLMRPFLADRTPMLMLSIFNEIMDYLQEYGMEWENKSMEEVGRLTAYIYVNRYLGTLAEDRLLEFLEDKLELTQDDHHKIFMMYFDKTVEFHKQGLFQEAKEALKSCYEHVYDAYGGDDAVVKPHLSNLQEVSQLLEKDLAKVSKKRRQDNFDLLDKLTF